MVIFRKVLIFAQYFAFLWAKTTENKQLIIK